MDIFTLEQAAHFLQLDAASLRQLAERGEVPGRRLGREWRFSRSHLADWAAGVSEQPTRSAAPSRSSSPAAAGVTSAGAARNGSAGGSMTVAQAAELLGVSTMTVRKWADSGRVQSARTKGGHRMFQRDDLLAAQQDGTATRRRGGRPAAAAGAPSRNGSAASSSASTRRAKPARTAKGKGNGKGARGGKPGDLLTIGDAANYLGISSITLRKWSNDDKVTSERTEAGHRRYRRDELDRVKASRA